MIYNPKTLLLSSLISFFLAIPYPQGMEPELPEHTKACCLASLAVYGDEHEGSKNARLTLENSNYKCDQAYENPSVNLRMELWKHLNGQSFIAIRGTIPTLGNLLSDAAIIKYGIDRPNPYAYLTDFTTTIATNWQKNNLINDPAEVFVESLPSSSTIHHMIDKIGAAVGSLSGYGVGTLTMGAVGTVGLVGILGYAAYQYAGNYHPETTAINTLLATSQGALKKTNEWIENCLQNGCSLPILTGHSLGGYVVTVVTELSPKLTTVLSFNAPGGAERFIRAQKNMSWGSKMIWPHGGRNPL